MSDDIAGDCNEKVDVYKNRGGCFGTFDDKFDDCTIKCMLAERCRKDTLSASRPAEPSVSVDDSVPEFREMEPIDYLLECLKGRFDVDEVNRKDVRAFRFRKGKIVRGMVTILPSGRIQFKTSDARLQIDSGLKSCKQASEIFKAILLA